MWSWYPSFFFFGCSETTGRRKSPVSYDVDLELLRPFAAICRPLTVKPLSIDCRDESGEETAAEDSWSLFCGPTSEGWESFDSSSFVAADWQFWWVFGLRRVRFVSVSFAVVSIGRRPRCTLEEEGVGEEPCRAQGIVCSTRLDYHLGFVPEWMR